MNLRERVEALLPNWQSWYPSLFDAAADLGLIRARVCAPSQLMISNRHANNYNEAVQAFREQWSVEDTEAEQSAAAAVMRGIKAHPPRKKIARR
jgi:hypothetical protein